MQQKLDGTFGDIVPAHRLLAQLQEKGVDDLKAVFFGSVNQLREVKKETARVNGERERLAEVEHRINHLEARVNAATVAQHGHGVRVYPADALPKETVR